MIHNFNAGPSILPKEVFEQASQAILEYGNSGISLLEMGHRTPDFTAIMEEARDLVKELMHLDNDHKVLFLHGGASTQFMQVPMNLLDPKDSAAYADTGVWSSKAIKEAALFGKVDVVCSSKENRYRNIPKDFAVPNDCKYFHITTNNTIYGTQWPTIPKTSNVMVADMSSDIFSRVIDFKSFGLIYAGAQKNMGPAGATIVIIKEEILGKVTRKIPSMMNYQVHADKESMFNTPPVFAVYTSMLNMRWIDAQGGIDRLKELEQQYSGYEYYQKAVNRDGVQYHLNK